MAPSEHDTFRVTLVGAESTGKTTLASQLAARLRAPWVPEFAREYATRMARPLGPADVEPIARGQLALEDHALASRPPLLILDTDLVSTVVYSRFYYGTCPEWVVAAARERTSGLYLLLATDLEFLPDPVRDRAAARAEIQEYFRAELHAFTANVVEVSGLDTQRVRRALDAIAAHRPGLIDPGA